MQGTGAGVQVEGKLFNGEIVNFDQLENRGRFLRSGSRVLVQVGFIILAISLGYLAPPFIQSFTPIGIVVLFLIFYVGLAIGYFFTPFTRIRRLIGIQ